MLVNVRLLVPIMTTCFATALCLMSVALLSSQLASSSKSQVVRDIDYTTTNLVRSWNGRVVSLLTKMAIFSQYVEKGSIVLPNESEVDNVNSPKMRAFLQSLGGASGEGVPYTAIRYRSGRRIVATRTPSFLVSVVGDSEEMTVYAPNASGLNVPVRSIRRNMLDDINETQRFLLDMDKPEALTTTQCLLGIGRLGWISTTAEAATILSTATMTLYEPGKTKPTALLSSAVDLFSLLVTPFNSSQTFYILLDDKVVGSSDGTDVTAATGESECHRNDKDTSRPRCFRSVESINSPMLQAMLREDPSLVRQGSHRSDHIFFSNFAAMRVPIETMRVLRNGQWTTPYSAIIIVNYPPGTETTLITYSSREFKPIGYLVYGVIAVIFAATITGLCTWFSLKPVLALPKTLRTASRLRAGGYVKKVSRFSEVASLQHSYNATKHRLDEMMRFLPHYILVRLANENISGSSTTGTDASDSDFDDDLSVPQGSMRVSAREQSRMADVPTNETAGGAPVVPLDVLLDETGGAYADSRCTVMYLLLDAAEGRADEDEELTLSGFASRRTFLSSAVAEVTRHGGVVDQLTGRSLTATFNCHTAVARHQEQASLAAINIHRFAAASTAANCPYAVMLDADHAASVTVGTDGARSRLVISRALSVVKKVAPLLLAHGCRVGATERVTSVVPLQHVPLDCVRLTLDFASTGIPSGLEKAERVCELIDSEKTDDFDGSVLFINTAFDEMRAGAYSAAKRQWKLADKQHRHGGVAGSYDESRIKRMISTCDLLESQTKGQVPYVNAEKPSFSYWKSEERAAGLDREDFLTVAAGSGRTEVNGPRLGAGPFAGADGAGSATGLLSATSMMGGSYTGAEDPPMFGDSYTGMDSGTEVEEKEQELRFDFVASQ